MTVKIDLVEGNLPSANAFTDFTIPGFGVVKGAIIFAMDAPSAATVTADAQLSVGLYDGLGVGFLEHQAACSFYSQDNTTVADERRNSGLGVSIFLCGTTATVIANYSATNVTDGIRLTKNAATQDCWVRCILFGGDGLEVGELRGIELSSYSTPHTFSDLACTPNLLFAITPGIDALATDTADSLFSFGVAGLHQGSILKQFSNNFSAEDNTSGAPSSINHRSTLKDGNILAPININSSNPFLTLTIEQFVPNGFRFRWTDVTSPALCFFLPISILDPTSIYLDNSNIPAFAASWLSAAAPRAPVFGMFGMIDGVTATSTGFHSTGAINITAATPSKCYSSSFLMDPSGDGARTISKQLRTSAISVWRALVKGAGTFIEGVFAFDGSNRIALTSLVGVPARATQLWYLMIMDSRDLKIKEGPDPIYAVYKGTDPITAVFIGPDQIF